MSNPSRSPAQKAADARYKSGLARVAFDIQSDDPILARLDRLAKIHGSRKAAIVMAINNMEVF